MASASTRRPTTVAATATASPTPARGSKATAHPNGIEVQDGARDVTVGGNVIENCSADGIQVSTHTGKTGCINVSIDGNTVRNCESGVFVKGISGTSQIAVTVSNNQIIGTVDTSLYGLQAAYTEDVVFVGNTVNNRVNAGRLANSNLRTIISNNNFRCSLSAGNDKKGFLILRHIHYVRFAGNIISNYGWKGLEISGTVSNMQVVNNHIAGCTNGSGAAVRWDSPTSSKCVLNGNYLQGTHWSYDAATSTYDVLACQLDRNLEHERYIKISPKYIWGLQPRNKLHRLDKGNKNGQ